MSPIFQPDFAAVESSIPVFDKVRAQIQITGKKGVIRESKDQEGKVRVTASVQYNLEMIGAVNPENGKLITKDYKGRTVSPYRVWLHTEGGWTFGKPFLMASCGYFPRKQEQEANEKLFQSNDWTFSGEPGDASEAIKLGGGWDLPVGRIVEVTLTKSIDNNEKTGETYENQEFSGWTPVE